MSVDGYTLTSLPQEVGRLSQLQRLNVINCRNLGNLRDIFGNLSSRQLLEVVNCKISSMPSSFMRLSNL